MIDAATKAGLQQQVVAARDRAAATETALRNSASTAFNQEATTASIQVENARVAKAMAAIRKAEARRVAMAASAAKARCSDAAMFVAREGVQVHGGIGFTWEHEITHHFRRVATRRNLYGTPGLHRALVAEGMGF